MVESQCFRVSRIAMVLLAFSAVFLGHPGFAADWRITQLTDNDFDERSPKICGGNVAWEGWDGNDWEIFYYDGSIKQLTNNDYDDTYPAICGSRVAWVGDVATGARDVFLYEEGNVFQLTHGNEWSMPPQLSAVDVVWAALDGNDLEIYRHASDGTTQLTDNDGTDWDPWTDGSRVVWSGTDESTTNPENIYVFDGTSIERITDSPKSDQRPRMSGENIVWHRRDSWGNREVCFYDGTSVTEVTGPDWEDDANPRVSGSVMVWMHWEYLSDYEIKLYDHESGITQQLTYDRRNDQNPEMDGTLVVWESWQGDSAEIIVYDMMTSAKTELTKNSTIDRWPDISGTAVVWEGSDGSDFEIFLAVLETRIPGDLNADGMVGSADLDIVRSNWSASVSPGDLSRGDASGDGKVGSADLDIVRSQWGSAAAVPEPASVVWLAALLATAGLFRSRRRVRQTRVYPQ